METLLESLTLEQKIGQLFMLAFRADESGENTMTEFNSTMSEALERYNPAGVILFSENISTKGQVSKLIGDLQEHSNIPLFIAVDEEGGKVSRIGGLYEEKIPDAVETASAEEARARGEELGRRLSELGFNMDFAPVADINTNPNNTVIGSRAFSDDPATAAEYVSAFSEAMLGTGVIPVAKHFPGHGDTGEDSHQGMAVFRHGLDRLMEYEIKPFAAGIDAGACVLVGHISAPEITGDALPATFSRELVTGILRGRLGYDGLVITDAMDMGAITEYYPPGEAAVLAIEAGVDIVLMPGDVDAAYNGVLEAVAEERLTEERIDQSVLRVLGLKTSARRASAP